MFMRPPTAAIVLLGAVVLTAPSWAGMHRDATPEIAAVLQDFVHACTPAQCAELEGIASDPASTRDDRVLAKVALGIDHTPDPADAHGLKHWQITRTPRRRLASSRASFFGSSTSRRPKTVQNSNG